MCKKIYLFICFLYFENGINCKIMYTYNLCIIYLSCGLKLIVSGGYNFMN